MKEIRKEITTSYTAYEAVDGTEFRDRAECERYENSAKGVLRGKLKKITLDDSHSCGDVIEGNDDDPCLALAPKNQQDVDIILQNYYLDNNWVLSNDSKTFREKVEKAVQEAFENKDVVLFGLNEEDCMYFINTRQNIINNLNNLGKKEEQSDK